MPDVMGVLLNSCYCPLISRDKKRVTENYILRSLNSSFPKSHIMCPFCHGHYREVCDTLQGYWSCTHMIPGHTGSTPGQSCLMWGPDICRPQGTSQSSLPSVTGFPDVPSFRAPW
jgi:hypothetical protein